jgi:hypothetical protein
VFHFLPENTELEVQLWLVESLGDSDIQKAEQRGPKQTKRVVLGSVCLSTKCTEPSVVEKSNGMRPELFVGEEHRPLGGWAMGQLPN